METLKKLSYIFSKKQKINIVVLFVMMFIGALFDLMGLALILPFVQLIIEPDLINQNALLHQIYVGTRLGSVNQFLFVISILLIIIYCVKNVFLFFLHFMQYQFIYHSQLKLSTMLMNCYMEKSYLYHLQKNSSEIMRNITVDVNQLFALVLNYLQLCTDFIIVLLLASYLLLLNPAIALTLAALFLLCVLFFFFVCQKKIKKYGDLNQKYNGKMIKSVNQALGGLKEIKVMNREQFFVEQYKKNGIQYVNMRKKVDTINLIPKFLLEMVCIVGMLIMISILLYFGGDVSNLIPQLSVFAMAAFRILPSVNRINVELSKILFLKPSVYVIYDDLTESGETYSGAYVKTRKKEEPDQNEPNPFLFHQDIKIKHVWFRYPGMDQYILKDVSMEIPKGKTIAFIGSSGVGKTTLGDLILGLLKPEKGQICAGDQDIYENLPEWSKILGYIPQSIFLSDDTIRENVTFGLISEKVEDEKVLRALEQAQLRSFVEGLENGLDTLVGERGIRLSGGQRQRIGIARALYHNPAILVLDEATSSLDNETESAVMEAIEHLQGEKTIIMIAHRLSTIANADLIFKVEKGQIIRT